MPFRTLLISLLTVLLVCEPALASTPMVGQVMVKGNAKINGVLTPSGANVFPGDQLVTETNAVAEVILNGDSQVVLPESSAVVLGNDASQVIISLNQGALAVLSKKSAPAFIEASGARIKPGADATVVFEVAVLGNTLKVLARRGSAVVETADKTLEVEEGKELDATMAPASPQSPAGATAAPTGKLRKWVLITAAAGAGLTGLILGVRALTSSSQACPVVSPSSPTPASCP